MVGHFLIIWKIDQISTFYDIGFIITRIFWSILQMLGITLISKSVDENLRGTVFGIAGACLCLSVSISQVAGGYLYNLSKMAPFLIPLSMNGILLLTILVVLKMQKFEF